MSIKVIAGSARGRKLATPKDDLLRPTLARVREAILSMCVARVRPKYALDLYAGVGALGIELLSAGALHATFVEQEKEHIELIRKNLETTGFSDKADVIQKTLPEQWPHLRAQYNTVFIDPPYHVGLAHETLQAASEWIQLEKERIVVVQTEKGLELDEQYRELQLLQRKHYGKTTVHLYS